MRNRWPQLSPNQGHDQRNSRCCEGSAASLSVINSFVAFGRLEAYLTMMPDDYHASMFREQTVSVEDLQLNHMTGPAHGPPLLLLHGVLRRWQTFHPLLPHLVRWQLHGLDFPGHGASQRFDGEYCVRDYIQATAAFVRQQLPEPLMIYGHSLGAMVAAGVASELGGHIRGLILEDPPLDTMGHRIRETPLHSYFKGLRRWAGSDAPVDQIAQQLAHFVYEDPVSGVGIRLGDQRDCAQLRFLASCLRQLDPRVLNPIVEDRWLDGYHWREVFQQIHCPVLLLQADPAVGGMLIDADARQAAHASPNCLLVKLGGCGHGMHWSRTQEVANLANAFLESI